MMLTGAVALLAAALALTWYAVDRAQRAGWLNGPHGAHARLTRAGDMNLPRPGRAVTAAGGPVTLQAPAEDRAGPGQPGPLRSGFWDRHDRVRYAFWLAWHVPCRAVRGVADLPSAAVERIRYRLRRDDGWDGLDDDGRDIKDLFRGEAPVMAGHYDVPRPGEQPTASGPEGATGVNAQAGPGHPLSAGEMDPDAPWCPGCGFASYSAGPCEVCGYDDQNVPRPGHGTQRDAAAPLSSGHETPRPGYPGGCPNCGRPGFDGGVCGRCGWGYGWQPASEAAVSAVYGPGELPPAGTEPDGPWPPLAGERVSGSLSDDTDIISGVRVCAGRNPWVQPAPAPPLPSAWDWYARTGVPSALGYVADALRLPDAGIEPTVGAALADIWAMSQVRALAAAT